MKEKLKSINNIPFVLALSILLLNDFYLKTEFHNWLTGKLSDFCGLFVFVLFWSALFPDKKRTIYFLTTFIFVIWKSPFSQPFIDLFSHFLYPIYRVVDFSDLIALSILPIAYFVKPDCIFRVKLNPIGLGLITVFSFCATSLPRPLQKFESPQYLLFKNDVRELNNSEYADIYELHVIDSLILVDLEQIGISKIPALDDEYHKAQVLKNLDLRFLKEQFDRFDRNNDPSIYQNLLDSLTIDGSTSIEFKKDSIRDQLNFKGTRLNGSFKRYENNILSIDGKYKNGIEDSIWSYYNYQNELISKKYFEKGELVKHLHYENSNIKSELNFNTRRDTVRNKYFLIAILVLLLVGLITRLYQNAMQSNKTNVLLTNHGSKIGVAIILPGLILALAKLISYVIPNTYSPLFMEIFFEAILVYAIIFPTLLIIFYQVKLRNKYDLIFYILLFAIGIILIEECLFLKQLLI